MSKKNPSRNERFDEVLGLVSQAKSDMEELRDELQNWLDNLPESLQNGTKAESLQEAIDELDNGINSLDEVENVSVSFPSMFG